MSQGGGEIAGYVLPQFPVPDEADTREAREALRLSPIFLKAWSAPGVAEKYGIAVERMRAPVLLVSGTADALWPSAIGAARIVERLEANGYAFPVTHARYEGAGHGISIRGNLR